MEPIKLKYPVTVTATNGTKTVLESVTIMDRPKARELRNVPPSAFQDNPSVAGVALYCGLPFDVAEDLDIDDVFDILKAMSGKQSLTSAFSGTGEKSSGESPESTTSPQT